MQGRIGWNQKFLLFSTHRQCCRLCSHLGFCSAHLHHRIFVEWRRCSSLDYGARINLKRFVLQQSWHTCAGCIGSNWRSRRNSWRLWAADRFLLAIVLSFHFSAAHLVWWGKSDSGQIADEETDASYKYSANKLFLHQLISPQSWNVSKRIESEERTKWNNCAQIYLFELLFAHIGFSLKYCRISFARALTNWWNFHG